MNQPGDLWDRAAKATEIDLGQGGEPSGEEKMIAAATYLLGFIGFWLVGALVIYFWQRKRSVFVAYHAVQSVILQAWIFVVVSSAVVLVLVGFVGMAWAGSRSSIGGWFPYVLTGGLMLMYGFIIIAPIYWHLRGAWVAAQGKLYHAPIFGRLADKFIDPAPPSPPTNAA